VLTLALLALNSFELNASSAFNLRNVFVFVNFWKEELTCQHMVID